MVYTPATMFTSQDQSLWLRAETALRQHLPEEEYDDWFDEVRLLECNGSNVIYRTKLYPVVVIGFLWIARSKPAERRRKFNRGRKRNRFGRGARSSARDFDADFAGGL